MSVLETLQGTYRPGIYKMGRCNIIVTIDDGLWHLSISTPDCSPSYNEIIDAAQQYFIL
jgi:hypothetical protein